MRYAVLSLLLLPLSAGAQTLTGDAGLEVGVWSRPHEQYRHTLAVGGSGTLSYKAVSITGYGTLKMWGAAKTRFDSNPAYPLTAEWRRVVERRHGAYILLSVGDFRIGPQIHRTAVHHVWQHRKIEGRHAYFPLGDWRDAKRSCSDGDHDPVAAWTDGDCPSIGYWEAVGVRVEYSTARVDAHVSVLPIRYKTLTLPPLYGYGALEVELGRLWSVGITGEVSVEGKVYGDLSVRRDVGPLYVEVQIGRVKAPDWTKEFWRGGLVVGI